MKNHHVFEKYGVIELTFSLPDTNSIFGKIPKRDWLEINLTGNNKEDKAKLDSAQPELKNLVPDSSGTKGVRFHFEEKAKYKTFIYTLNIIRSENIKTYLIKDDDIWAFIPEHVKIIPDSLKFPDPPLFHCGTAAIQSRFLKYEQDAKDEEEKRIAEEVYDKQMQKKLIIPIALYLIILFLAIKRFFV